MLRAEHRRRHQHGDLLAVHHRLEGRAHGDLRLAEADVAADQAVHRLAALHVGEHVLDRGELVRGLFVRERAFELLERAIARREREALRQLARGVDAEQLARHVAQRLPDLPLGLLPGEAAELVDARRHTFRTDVALHQRQAVHRDEEAIAAVVLDAQELVLLAPRRTDVEQHQPAVDADAVLAVHEVVAGLQLRERLERRRLAHRHLRAAPLARAEDLFLGDDDGAREREHEALGDRRDAHFELARPPPARDLARVARQLRVVAVFEQELAHALGAGERRRRDHHAPAFRAPALDRLDQRQQRGVAGAAPREFAAQLVVIARSQRDALGAVVALDVESLEPDGLAQRERRLDRRRRRAATRRAAQRRGPPRGPRRNSARLPRRIAAAVRAPLPAPRSPRAHPPAGVRRSIRRPAGSTAPAPRRPAAVSRAAACRASRRCCARLRPAPRRARGSRRCARSRVRGRAGSRAAAAAPRRRVAPGSAGSRRRTRESTRPRRR